jgi:CheY-like chemotaxis protein
MTVCQAGDVLSPEIPHVTPRRYGILIVDDEEGVRGLLTLWLPQQGFAVWQVAGGQAALDLYRSHGRAIDAVLMDVSMPGMDGPQALAALRAMNPRVRCCFMSGDLGGHTERSLCDLGAAGVLRKPFRLAEVTRVLRELVGGVGR